MAKKTSQRSVNSIVKSLGFPALTDVSGLHSNAHLFGTSKPRCGIYLLGFADGLFYIGQAVNAVKRFAQHRRGHDDIVFFSFQRCRQGFLGPREREVIHEAEARQLPMANKVHVSRVVGETDFDLIMPPKQQESWLRAPKRWNARQKIERVDLGDSQRSRFSQKFARFEKDLHAGSILDILKTYIVGSVPAYRRSEYSFWSLTCLPSTGGGSRLTCVNINTMEVLVVGRYKGTGNLHWGFVNVSLDELSSNFEDADEFMKDHPDTLLEESRYQAAGSDQVAIRCESLPVIRDLLEDERILQAAAVLNLNLMRKGPTVYSRFHCIDLADRVLDGR